MSIVDFLHKLALIYIIFTISMVLTIKSYGDTVWKPYSITKTPVNTNRQRGIVIPADTINNSLNDKVDSANIVSKIFPNSTSKINKDKSLLNKNININLLNKDNEIRSLLSKNVKLRDNVKLDILKRDRQISNLIITNNELKSKAISLNKKVSKLSV